MMSMGYVARVATTATAISLFTLKSVPMGSLEKSWNLAGDSARIASTAGSPSAPFAFQDPHEETGRTQATTHLVPTRCWVVGRSALIGGNVSARSNSARSMAIPPGPAGSSTWVVKVPETLVAVTALEGICRALHAATSLLMPPLAKHRLLIMPPDGHAGVPGVSTTNVQVIRIYAAGLVLPDVEPESERVDARTTESPLRRLGALLGRYDSYLEIYDPYEEGEPVHGLISDDLADVYLDLVEPLAAFESGRVQDAVWSWRFNIRGHCGDHIVDAMRAIHRLIHLHMPEDYVAGGEDVG